MNLNMTSAESVLAQIQGLSRNSADLTQLRHCLKKCGAPLLADSARLLRELDPSIHSLGYLFLLEARATSAISKAQDSELVTTVAKFIDVCAAEQIRLAPEKFISLCKRLKELVLQVGNPMRGVAPMLTALRKLQTSSQHLTTLHSDFLLLCLLSKCYKAGFSVLEDDIFEVDLPRDLLLYCYYGGMICIGQKKYHKALELLHNVVTSPMPKMSAIAFEAYKKYVLVSLIHLGQFSDSLPKYASSAAQRNLKNSSQPYMELVNSYRTGVMYELEMCVRNNKSKFESDTNLGLVKQVVSSMYKRNIQRLTQTYVTLSLQDIANSVQLNGPNEAEKHVLRMIQEGEIYATINQKDGMVRFLEDPEQYKSREMIDRVDLSIERIMMLTKKLNSMNETMSRDPSYLGKVGKERQRMDFDDDYYDTTTPSMFHM